MGLGRERTGGWTVDVDFGTCLALEPDLSCRPPLHDYAYRQLPLLFFYGHYSWSQLPWKVTWIKQLTIGGKRNAGLMATIVDT